MAELAGLSVVRLVVQMPNPKIRGGSFFHQSFSDFASEEAEKEDRSASTADQRSFIFSLFSLASALFETAFALRCKAESR